MKNKKKSILICAVTAVLLLCVCLSVSGCGSSDTGGGSTEPDNKKASYTVTWKDENGATLTTTTVDEGATPSYTYAKQDTAEWDYTVDGWSLTQGGQVLTSIPTAAANATYYAVVSKVKQRYTATFNTTGGSDIAAVTKDYNETVTKPSDPTQDGKKFVGWFTNSTLTTQAVWPFTLTENVTFYAKWNDRVDIGAYLDALIEGYDRNPYSYIPETMQPSYSPNLIGQSDIVTDYSAFVNKSDIKGSGYGEQWNMILTNVQQSMTFFNVLSVVDTLSTSVVTAFNNYLDSNPSDTAHYAFASGIYSVTVDFDGAVMYYVIDYTAQIPVLGQQTVQIALSMDVATSDKTVRVQLGDANALKYTVTEDGYSFAIKYAGVRRAYFSVERNTDGKVEGHINEILTVAGKEVKSAADFYIGDGYATAVGNKADGMIGFTGYISELYSLGNGKLIGYEVQETLSSIVYNTLWFDLSEVRGIDSIKYAADGEKSYFYVNGGSAKWANKKVGGLSLKTASRRFDLEFRKQYFYSYDDASDTYTQIEAQVPMLFVQEEFYESLSDDVSDVNSGVGLSVTVGANDLTKLMEDYDDLIPLFAQNKENITAEIIIAYIGNKVSFA